MTSESCQRSYRMSSTESLFAPITLGTLELPNRIAMAPMTRGFSPNNVPNELMVEYYRRRAAGGVGLIITEGTCCPVYTSPNPRYRTRARMPSAA